MKTFVLVFLFLVSASFKEAVAHQKTSLVFPSDTIRDIKNQRKPQVVKGRKKRMQMQLRQIRQHEQQGKKVDKMQKELHHN